MHGVRPANMAHGDDPHPVPARLEAMEMASLAKPAKNRSSKPAAATAICSAALAWVVSIALVFGTGAGLAYADNGAGASTGSAATNGSSQSLSLTTSATGTASALNYSYEVTPLIAPFNKVLYVKTDNPDPLSFQLADLDVAETEWDDYVPYRVLGVCFSDVKYENRSTYRVPGGYLICDSSETADGGELALLVWPQEGGGYVETGRTVYCPPLKSPSRYLIDTYTNSSVGFFDKLSAIESGLQSLAVYPRAIVDSSQSPVSHPYPYFACSPYEELGLKAHVDIYPTSGADLLLRVTYPFVLDSVDFPNLMGAVAKKLDPTCTVKRNSVHSMEDVTKDGVTRSYGGAGNGGSGSI